MQNKLQELTDKLYTEGLSKGKQEGEQIVAKARVEADEIIARAKAEAEAITAKAAKDAEDLKSKTASDIRTASLESISATRQAIENLVVGKMNEAAVKNALGEDEFVKEIIREVASRFSTQESADLEIVLPEAFKAKVGPFVEKELAAMLGKGISASWSRKISGGFTIGPKDGGWFISFTDAAFTELISAYLRPATRKILFGE